MMWRKFTEISWDGSTRDIWINTDRIDAVRVQNCEGGNYGGRTITHLVYMGDSEEPSITVTETPENILGITKW